MCALQGRDNEGCTVDTPKQTCDTPALLYSTCPKSPSGDLVEHDSQNHKNIGSGACREGRRWVHQKTKCPSPDAVYVGAPARSLDAVLPHPVILLDENVALCGADIRAQQQQHLSLSRSQRPQGRCLQPAGQPYTHTLIHKDVHCNTTSTSSLPALLLVARSSIDTPAGST